ncbi:MAG: 3-methyl-2-oxobutanoate dehydrogenase subunit VorB [Spirochaetaceae bacterium]|jgi:2-oxoglutarate ferredoxin oxidoreductase subunit alpha|nr:3-methyl-2-oxobutanoate dehydrogenase subunit VorB [Spirochaetaceae bacterium]
MSKTVLMKGNEALAEAAIRAGCTHYFGYPITPQNEIPAYMAKEMPGRGGCFLQAESEIAAINMVFGASGAGARTMTSTSSPGMSLKQEGLSYLAGAELPCVVVNMMRGGPGLGGIAGSQADYFQATRGGGNGDYRSIVLAPGNVQELADLTVDAFELADKYRMVVTILGDGYLGQMSEPVILPEPTVNPPAKPWAVSGNKGRKPNQVMSLRLSPEDYLEKHNIHLQELYSRVEKEIPKAENFLTDDADYIIVSYGTSSRIVRKAVKALREEGIKAGLFRPITLWPYPMKELNELSKKVKKVLTVEMSAGQMLEDVKVAVNGAAEVDFYGKMGGAVPESAEIIKIVKSYR